MKYTFFPLLFVLLLVSCNKVPENQHPISVSENGHFLLKGNAPFFWLADTAWELFHRLNREEAEKYLQTRSNQGFNAFQAVILPELEAFTLPNAYGDFPLLDEDISKPNVTDGNDLSDQEQYDYFDHVEWILKKAGEYKMVAGLLPCWGEYVTPRKRERTISTTEQGYNYGWFIGNRYKSYNKNIVWILGGDRLPDEAENGVDVWRSMAEGIADAVNGVNEFNNKANYASTCMSYHCYASSSKWFHNDDWIDFHTWGSYHEKKDNPRAYTEAGKDWNLKNPKPTLNSEPAYEQIPVNYDWANAGNGYFDDFDVRQHAYWSVFSGTCGHTYGAHPVWQMSKTDLKYEPYAKTTNSTWEEALYFTGATQMDFLQKLILSRPYTDRRPAQETIIENYDEPGKFMTATAGKDYCMVYLPTGDKVHVNLEMFTAEKLKTWWFHPATGKAFDNGTIDLKANEWFDAPGDSERGNDWVLVIDDETKNYVAPGRIRIIK